MTFSPFTEADALKFSRQLAEGLSLGGQTPPASHPTPPVPPTPITPDDDGEGGGGDDDDNNNGCFEVYVSLVPPGHGSSYRSMITLDGEGLRAEMIASAVMQASAGALAQLGIYVPMLMAGLPARPPQPAPPTPPGPARPTPATVAQGEPCACPPCTARRRANGHTA
ncbi:hypothetical protein Psed_5764 [Pseudonocardia dioxanivorans CB1190]|uniref:Uncharacterized protein n=1 Tax=Pseudonocardia dioxanivorans (strain ATCC 55486 / DSM 44775 / JCM 13855 / CB1190) TaxID=675635 RepID=F4D1A3_PSEUX|nr:hypothetical protein [Pseudonocardia dioxanivorans]AEA27891.1 hypothetical protein Psed_5764 [Pseudonocardia dioxanivorans CB1190]